MILHFFSNLVIFIITLGILITIHEYGHFLAARALKVHIEQFSIGFGPALWQWQDTRGTKYTISAFLIGGYVKLLDTKNRTTSSNKTLDDTMYSKCIWKRSIIIIMGPIFNFIFAILLYVIIFIIGIPVDKPIINYIIPNSIIDQTEIPIRSEIKFINDLYVNDWTSVRLNILNNISNKRNIIIMTYCTENDKLNYTNHIINLSDNWLNQSVINTDNPIVALGILPNTICVKSIITNKKKFFFDEQYTLKIGDKILLINSQPVYSWESFVYIVKNSSKKTINLVIDRNSNLLYLNFNLCKQHYFYDKNRYNNMNLFFKTLVIESTPRSEIYRYEYLNAILQAFKKTWEFIYYMGHMLIQLFFGNFNIHNLHGPIAIAKGVGQSIHFGLIYYLMFLAMISINLGIINLLPIPILDGGQLFILLLEKIINHSISQKIQDLIYIISFVLLICITFLAIYNDITI